MSYVACIVCRRNFGILRPSASDARVCERCPPPSFDMRSFRGGAELQAPDAPEEEESPGATVVSFVRGEVPGSPPGFEDGDMVGDSDRRGPDDVLHEFEDGNAEHWPEEGGE